MLKCVEDGGFSFRLSVPEELMEEDDPFLFAGGGFAAVWGSGLHPVAFPVFVN